ncbi:hypothetical protein niasHT_011281 [Heterodera trifolii]|uniref:Uncharacterized protein n=1 Tax=Heterodera trifolii TaxID=157864 RepID=A0ABD2L6F7_9BILA
MAQNNAKGNYYQLGSGFSALLAECLTVEYGKKAKLEFFPFTPPRASGLNLKGGQSGDQLGWEGRRRGGGAISAGQSIGRWWSRTIPLTDHAQTDTLEHEDCSFMVEQRGAILPQILVGRKNLGMCSRPQRTNAILNRADRPTIVGLASPSARSLRVGERGHTNLVGHYPAGLITFPLATSGGGWGALGSVPLIEPFQRKIRAWAGGESPISAFEAGQSNGEVRTAVRRNVANSWPWCFAVPWGDREDAYGSLVMKELSSDGSGVDTYVEDEEEY